MITTDATDLWDAMEGDRSKVHYGYVSVSIRQMWHLLVEDLDILGMNIDVML